MAPPIIGVKKSKPVNLAPPKPKAEPKSDPLKDPLKDPLQPGWIKGEKGKQAPAKPKHLFTEEDSKVQAAIREHLFVANQYSGALNRAKTMEDANLARESKLIRGLEGFASALKGTRYEGQAQLMLEQAKQLRKVDKQVPASQELLAGAKRIANGKYKSKMLWQRADQMSLSDKFWERRMAKGVEKKARRMDKLVDEAEPMVKSLTQSYEKSTEQMIPDLGILAQTWSDIGVVGKRLDTYHWAFKLSEVRDNLLRLMRDPEVYAEVQGELTSVERANLEDWIAELRRGVLAENEENRKQDELLRAKKNPSPKN